VLEITNRNKFPMQLVIRAKRAPRTFTVLNLPGIGSGKNIFLLEEERSTDYILRAEKKGLITTKKILDTKGE
jgi:hypothetical protein